MIKKLMVALVAGLMLIPTTSKAEVMYSEKVGNWELIAWDGPKTQFCALKTYFPFSERTISLRKSTSRGMELVLFEPNFRFKTGAHPVLINIDGYVMDGVGFSYEDTPNQIFYSINEDSNFPPKFISGTSMTMQSSSFPYNYNLNLKGTAELMFKLNRCVNTFGY